MINFNKNAVRPIVCLREGWQLIKDQYWLFLGICLVGTLIGSIIRLIFINMVISLVGMSCCYVGSIFVMPLLLGTIVIAYKQVFHTPQIS